MVTLRADQIDLTCRARAAFKRTRKVLAQAMCGWGKTHFGCGIVASAYERRTPTLVIAHRRRLIQQWSDRLELFGVPHGIIMADLPEALAERHQNGTGILVASKDTLISRMDREGLPECGLVIVDEAHNLLGHEYTRLLANYEKAFHLGLTATPVAGNGRGLSAYFDELVCSPPASALIEAGVIVPFKVYAALEMAEARRSGGKVRPAGDPVVQWKRHAAGLPTVLFAPNVRTSKEVVAAFNKAGIPAVHIDAHSTEEEREAASSGLESGTIKVVSQVGLWTEGVDVPCVAVVQLMAKCGSLVKFIQAVWRAGRAFPGKTHAIVIDHTGAVFEHGFPDEDIEWALSDGDPCKKADTTDGKPSREPSVCVHCGLCYSGSLACPGCGSQLAINRQMYQPDLFAHLVEVDRDCETAVRVEAPQRQWTRLLYAFAHSGRTCSQLAAAFHAQTGIWPDAADVTPYEANAGRKERVADVYAEFVVRKSKKQETKEGLFT